MMTFQNTEERYQYIYGSSAWKLEEEPVEDLWPIPEIKTGPETRRQRPRPVIEEPAVEDPVPVENVQKNRARFLEFDWKYTMVVSLSILICVIACIFYLSKIAGINRMNSEIYDLETKKVVLLSKQEAIRSEIDNSINLEEIEAYAKKKLHLRHPEPSDVIKYDPCPSDYVRQYDSVEVPK